MSTPKLSSGLLAIVERNKRVYYLTQFLHSLVFTIPIWIVFYQKFVSVPQLSILVTFEYITQMVFEVPSGALADLIGRRKTILISFLIGTLRYFLFPIADNFNFFLILSLLGGLSDSFRSGSEEALVYDTFKQAGREKDFAAVYGNGNLIYQVGLIIATALGGVLYGISSAVPYVSYGFAFLLGSIATWFYIEPVLDSVKFNLRNYYAQMVDGCRDAFKDTYTKYLSFFYIFVGGIGWSSTLYFNEYMMVDLGFGNAVRGYLSAGMRLVNVILITRLLKNRQLFTFSRTILFFPLMMLIAYLPGKFLHGVWGLPFVQGAMIVTTARWIILSPLTNEAFSSKYRATAISALSLLIGVVYIAMTSISVFIIGNYGIKTMYTLLGVFSLLTVVPVSLKLLTARKVRLATTPQKIPSEEQETF